MEMVVQRVKDDAHQVVDVATVRRLGVLVLCVYIVVKYILVPMKYMRSAADHTLYIITTTDISQLRLACGSRYHSENVNGMLCVDSAVNGATFVRLGAYISTWKAAWIMHQPIRWFWSSTCGRLARNTLNTADCLLNCITILRFEIKKKHT